jgi:hypothetical protein
MQRDLGYRRFADFGEIKSAPRVNQNRRLGGTAESGTLPDHSVLIPALMADAIGSWFSQMRRDPRLRSWPAMGSLRL